MNDVAKTLDTYPTPYAHLLYIKISLRTHAHTYIYIPPCLAFHVAPPDIVQIKLSFLDTQKKAKELIVVVQYYTVKQEMQRPTDFICKCQQMPAAP
jgi:hypothetical protein